MPNPHTPQCDNLKRMLGYRWDNCARECYLPTVEAKVEPVRKPHPEGTTTHLSLMQLAWLRDGRI